MKLTRYTSALAAFLLLTAAAQSLPVSAFPAPAVRSGIAAEEDTAPADDAQKPLAEGTIGETITWTLDAEGTLTITGSGDMAAGTGNLFGSNAGKIKKAVIKNADSKNVITAIGAALFKNCIALADVTLPSTVTTIGSEAFSSCTALQKITLPDTLQSIGASAFAYSGLTEVNLPGCTIGNAAFFDCESLKAVTISEGTESIPAECFRKCLTLESATLPDSVKTIECGGYADQGAFADCPKLKTVSIGKSIEAINENAFRTGGDCLEVTFREGVTAVPESSFKNRSELVKVTLPDTLTDIGASAFNSCTSLAACEFPASLKEIGKGAFAYTALTEVNLPGCALGNSAFFDCEALKAVTIGEGTESIPAECFRKCLTLESATLPDSVKTIDCGGFADQGAFADCPKLKTVSIGKSIEAIHQNAFRTGGDCLEVTFREGVTAVPESSFKNRSELVKVTLPDTLETIGASAFNSCTALAACEFPASLKEIGKGAFAYTALTEVNLPGCALGNSAFFDCEALKAVTIGEGTESIPAECFRKCLTLESATLPDSVKTIDCGGFADQGAFADCPKLKTVSIGKSIETINQNAFRTGGNCLEVTFRKGVTAIPESSFKNRPELVKVTLPDTLETIGASAFNSCTALAVCEFPASLKEIGAGAFAYTALTEANLPGCTIGNAAFFDCESLKSVTIGEGTESIPAECFRKCLSLESAILPDSVKSIDCGAFSDQGAFADCVKLSDVTLGKSMEKINQNAFRTVSEDLTVTFREGITAIPDHMLDKTAVSKLILPKSVAEIGPDAVSGCSSLQEIVISAADCKIEDSEKTIPASAVITAAEGSTAQQYAKKYERAFKEDLLPGDLNGDKVISADDAQLVLTAYTDALAGMEMNLTAAQIKAGDIDGNGIISVEDAQYILTYYTENTVAGKDITWDDILPKKDTKA